MKQVTRNVDLNSVRDLLERVPRACIAFAHDHGPQAQPVALLWLDQHYCVGIPQGAARHPNSGQEVVLLVDEGVQYFDLRAIYIRGYLQPTETPADAPTGHIWMELTPLKTVAWDYGTMHEVNDEG